MFVKNYKNYAVFVFIKLFTILKFCNCHKTFYSINAQEFLKYLIVSRSPQKIENWTFIDSDDNAFLQNRC